LWSGLAGTITHASRSWLVVLLVLLYYRGQSMRYFLLWVEADSMRIKKLELRNFRCFEDYELELAERFTLLIGGNASGKTAILDSLAKGINCFLLSFPESEDIVITDDDMRATYERMGQTITREIAVITSIHIIGIFYNKKFEYKRSKSSQMSNLPNYIQDFTDHKLITETHNPKTIFPVIVYYGTGRLWNKIPNDVETLSPSSRLFGYENCLNSALGLERLLRWFKTQELAALQKQERRHVLEAVREAIISMTPTTENVWWDMDWDELFIKTAIQGKLQARPFRLLSDGYRNMVGMVADIAYRMATLNPQLESEAIKQTEGIVLIDEIDLHLHPNWQRIVVERLLNTFPKVQFVASSHSPFIIQSLYHLQDCLLWDLEKNQALEIDSKSIEDIAEDQQGVDIPQQSRRFMDMKKAAEEYYAVLKQIPAASEEEKHRLREKLDELLMPYSDDPAYQAFLEIKRLAIKDKEI
jgi:predicted ATP-binding protein involved in virulence